MHNHGEWAGLLKEPLCNLDYSTADPRRLGLDPERGERKDGSR